MRKVENNKMLAVGLVFVALFVIVFLVVNYGITSALDVSGFNLLNQTLNVSSLNWFFVLLTNYGREYFWIAVIALLWVFGRKTEKKTALVMVAVFIVIILVGTLLKDGYYRARPFLSISSAIVLVPIDSDSSFPSGHALIVMGGAAVALLMLKKRYSLPLLLEAVLVCYSRVYVGVHYPMDVIGGALLGAGIAALIVYLLLNTKYFERFFYNLLKIYKRVLSSLGLVV